jgi:hypothetical protein
MENNLKYKCEKCNFKCNTKARWENHVNTELHITGHRKKRSDYKEPIKCDNCEYNTKNITTLKIHKLNKHSTKEIREKEFTFYCKMCDYGSFSKDSFDIHNNTKKHINFLSIIK